MCALRNPARQAPAAEAETGQARAPAGPVSTLTTLQDQQLRVKGRPHHLVLPFHPDNPQNTVCFSRFQNGSSILKSRLDYTLAVLLICFHSVSLGSGSYTIFVAVSRNWCLVGQENFKNPGNSRLLRQQDSEKSPPCWDQHCFHAGKQGFAYSLS